MVDYTFTDWLWSFYDTSHINPTVEGAFPICYQFWFLRDLMVTMVFSPIVYLGVRYLKVLFILCLGILWLINFLPAIPGFSSAAMFYFHLVLILVFIKKILLQQCDHYCLYHY